MLLPGFVDRSVCFSTSLPVMFETLYAGLVSYLSNQRAMVLFVSRGGGIETLQISSERISGGSVHPPYPPVAA
jgi:hypothetical protein